MEPILARPFLILTVRKRIYLCALFCVIYNLSLQACYNRKSIFRYFKILLSMCKRLSVQHKCLSYIQIIITINHILYEYICLDNSMKRIRHEGHIDLWSRFSLSIGNILLKHDAEITFTLKKQSVSIFCCCNFQNYIDFLIDWNDTIIDGFYVQQAIRSTNLAIFIRSLNDYHGN